ncbi:hypothetical protein [Metabacillus sp. FJAT-52054]|uniref:Uncharacterized protein n=1 Tax=Metabacillus sediminis TaxID=3117746 RepID=A0ABZ2NIP2_9BACI
MTKVIEQHTAMEIVGNEELERLAQQEMLQRTKVLDKVREIFTFPNGGFISISTVAALYDVEEMKVISLLRVEELEGEHNLLVSRLDMLSVGFLLSESEVAQELRNQLTNIREVN